VAPPRINRYRADLREFRFRLFEQFGLGQLLGTAPYADWGEDEVNMVLDEVYKFVCERLGPLNAIGDAEGCTLEGGKVKTPPGFKEAWDALNEAGWTMLSVPAEHGGQGAPFALQTVVAELMSGANTSFNMYPALTSGAAEVITAFGSPAQIELYAKRMFAGQWGGTMCLTEPQAGSDVGAATTRAIKLADGRYKIQGTKIFISAGDHDLTRTIVHMVLARTEGAPEGTRGLSLFIVPRDKVAPDGTVGGSNDVSVGNIEHKMGIKGSSTCVLNFGENDDCVGELVGPEEHQGMKQMFHLMNHARIGVGVQGVAVASAAYLSALDYAKERKQGPSIRQWKNPAAPKVPIILHPDVRRMLIDMKARVEGIRALILKLAVHHDRERVLKGTDPAQAAYHKSQIDLLVPLVKAYGSDQAFRVCETAMQTYGGAGYCADHPVEQYCRDAKIFSIYEGTNHIQAMDLVGRKLAQKNGANLQAFVADVGKFVEQHREHPRVKDGVAVLAKAMEALTGTAMRLFGWSQMGQIELVPLAANAFLEMMAETTVGWLLLDGAVIAVREAGERDPGDPDQAFYAGKLHSALHFAHSVLPNVATRAAMLARGDRSALDIPDEGF
jgi:alkylation response protein AidB-like acyl-CoA dehydrogenase